MTGGSELSLPGRRAKMLPIVSMVMLQPAWVHHVWNRSRAWRSRSVKARRQTPPFSVAPILANSIRLSHSRLPSIRMLVVIDPPRRSALFGGFAHRIVGVLRPVQIRLPRFHRHHGDAVRHGADVLAQITADALLVNDPVAPAAVDPLGGDRLVRGVLAGDVAKPAGNAKILIDPGNGLEIHVQELPVGDIRHRLAPEVVETAIALLVHPV